ETGEKTLYRVWFCKSRLCPMCNWRRAMKHGIQSQKVVAEVIKQKPTVRWLFLTLTVRNVYDGTELNKSLSDMSKGFNRIMNYKKIIKNLVGFLGATEVTVNILVILNTKQFKWLFVLKALYFINIKNFLIKMN